MLRHHGEKYVFSPYDLAWDGKFYYVIGYSEKYSTISNIRVDRIAHTPEIMAEPGIPMPDNFDLNEYKRTMDSFFQNNIGSFCLRYSMLRAPATTKNTVRHRRAVFFCRLPAGQDACPQTENAPRQRTPRTRC